MSENAYWLKCTCGAEYRIARYHVADGKWHATDEIGTRLSEWFAAHSSCPNGRGWGSRFTFVDENPGYPEDGHA
jgi:hypothetical protein